MYNFLIKYKYWFIAIGFIALLQVATFYIASKYSSMMKQQHLQSLAQRIDNEISQSILDKQRATMAIAFALNHDLSELDLTEKNLAQNIKFNALIVKIQKHSAYKNFRVQVVNKDGMVLYRSWTSEYENLSKIHPEFNLALQKGEVINSIASGKFGVVLKTVTPIVQQNKIVGFLDFISEFNSIQTSLKTKKIDSLVIATKERSKLVTAPFSPNHIGSFYLSNLNPNQSLVKKLNESLLEDWQTRPENYWLWQGKLVVKYPLKSIDNKIHAYVFGISSISELTSQTEEYISLLNTKNYIVMVCVIVSIVLLMGLALFFVRSQKQYYQDIFNYEEEAVLVTNGEQWSDANTQLLSYFPSLIDSREGCICDFFEEGEEFLQKNMNGILWIDYLVQNTDKQNKILITHNGNKIVFQVKARLLKQASNEYVVVLNNITESETLNHQLQELSLIDELTQVGNRRSFNETLQRELTLSKRNGFSCSLISFEIDHFKQVNDNYGHAIGDEVLKQVALTSRLQLRSTDRLFRVGGEEFIVLLPMQGHDEAEIVAEKIRKKIASTAFEQVGQVTASFGVIESHHEDDISSLLIRADEAMYLAKASGRNRVKVVKHG